MENAATIAQQAAIVNNRAVMAHTTGDGGVVIRNEEGTFLIDRAGNMYDLELIETAVICLETALKFEMKETGGIH